MGITATINAIRVNQEDQTVYITLDRDGTEYKFHADTPILDEPDTLAYLTKRKDEYFSLIIGKMYPGSDWIRFKTDDNTTLEAILAWVADGHRNLIGEDENGDPVYLTIELIPYQSTHPIWVQLETEIDSITTIAGLRVFLKKIIRRIA